MEWTLSSFRKLMLILPFASFVVLALASPAFARVVSVKEPMKASAAMQGLKVDMSHVDSFMDKSILHSPDRLRRAVERSISRAQALTSHAKSTYTLQAQADAKAAPVYSGDGAYLVNLSLGTPPQSFNGILDTGSDLVWRQSKPCSECYPEADRYFDPSNSSTYNTVGCDDALCDALPEPLCAASECQYTYSYGDGSSTMGVLSSDTLTIGGTTVEKFAFGAGNVNYVSQNTSAAADGVVGMGGGPLSLSSQMSSTIEGKFSYCLVTWTDAPSKTSPLLLGASADISGPKVVSTPFVSNPLMPTFYYLNLKGISFNGKSLSIPPGTFDLQPDGSGGVIIDSGTTITFLADAAYSLIKQAYQSVINLPEVDGSTIGLDLCYDDTNNASVAIPPLTFNFDGGDVEVPPENIFFNFQGYLCLGMMGASSSLGVDINIYGNFQQQNFQILFDKGSANQLSLKPTTC